MRRRPGHAARRRREGAAAVEFGLVAAPFFFLLFAILELGLVLLLDAVLETAVNDTARMIRTGEADRGGGLDEAGFKAAVCARMGVFSGDCGSRLTVDVRPVTTFSDALDDPMADGEEDADKLKFDRGQREQLMVARAWYRHTLITPLMHQALPRMKDGAALLGVTVAFRNEPP